jgi:hypothetical protein
MDKAYMKGWSEAARMVAAGFSMRECVGYARFALSFRRDSFSEGFIDAILSGGGA